MTASRLGRPRHAEVVGVVHLEGGRAHERDVGAHRLERGHEAAAHAAVAEVAHDGDLEAVEVAEVLADGVEVEHGLRGVLVLSVARVDDDGVGVLGDLLRRSGELGAADEHVDVHGVDGLDGVREALTLHDGGGGAAHREAVGGEALLGELEGALGAGRGLKEQVHDRAAAQRGNLLDGALVHLGERAGRVEATGAMSSAVRLVVSMRCLTESISVLPSLGGRERPDLDRVFLVIGRDGNAHVLLARGRDVLANVVSADGAVWRWPRSIMTASWTVLGRPRSMRASSAARIVRPV